MSARTTFRSAALAIAVAATALAGSLAPTADAAPDRRGAPLAVPDPATAGPYTAVGEVYDFGDTAFTFPGFPGPVEDRGVVYRPSDLSGGPFPLVIFLHGRHEACVGEQSWPCSDPALRVKSYRGYDYLARNLATHGYIVASISANGINAADFDVADGGADARGRLVLAHLDQWKAWATTGGAPFGTTYVGKVDLGRVGLMGHSRGGEGVAAAIRRNQALPAGDRYGIKAAVLLAPTDFGRTRLHGVHLGVVLPYCDGDVSDLQGVHYYDDGLYDDRNDWTNRHSFLIDGANHNFFNTEWTPGAATGSDDSGYPDGDVCDRSARGTIRLSGLAQRATGIVYVDGFLRRYLGEPALAPWFTGGKTPPPSLGSTRVLSGFHPTQVGGNRLDVARMASKAELTTDTLGGPVTTIDVFRDLCGRGDAGTEPLCLPYAYAPGDPRDIHSTDAGGVPGLNQQRVAWGSTSARVRFAIPATKGDVTGWSALTFRGALNPDFTLNRTGIDGDLSVALVDRTGKAATVRASTYSRALRYPPGRGGILGSTPRLALTTVRIPMSAFAGIDLTQVRRITLVLDRRDRGVVDLANLAFVKG